MFILEFISEIAPVLPQIHAVCGQWVTVHVAEEAHMVSMKAKGVPRSGMAYLASSGGERRYASRSVKLVLRLTGGPKVAWGKRNGAGWGVGEAGEGR